MIFSAFTKLQNSILGPKFYNLKLLDNILDWSIDPPSPGRGNAGEEVDGPLAIEGVVEDVATDGSRSHGSGQIRRLVDEESNEESS